MNYRIFLVYMDENSLAYIYILSCMRAADSGDYGLFLQGNFIIIFTIKME